MEEARKTTTNSSRDNLGQKNDVWNNWWDKINPLSEIRMWDYYGGRPWILKYTPRFGKVIEGGCGVGRYVFYLRRLGINIEGIDFSEEAIEKLNRTKNSIDKDASFEKGDVTNLPYADNSLSGYLSFGVVEHFIDGPQKPILEAFQKLRPGGIAIITTPNVSFIVFYRRLISKFKNLIKILLNRRINEIPFFQYEYRPKKLKRFVKEAGFYVCRSENCDLLYPFTEIGSFSGKNIRKGTFAFWFANSFENSWINRLGAQTIIIAVKKGPLMHCFLCGKLSATQDSLVKYDVPIASECQNKEIAKYYLRSKKVKYAQKFIIEPEILIPEKRICEISKKEYLTDSVFEEFGFNKNISPDLLRIPEINIELGVNNVKPIWRKRKG